MSESMHHDHDLDLISALAEGTLADPGPAHDLIASCAECAALFRAHLTVRQAVETETSPWMTDIERARLHTSLWDEVRRPATPAPRPSSAWWYRLAPVAAVLVVVVGVGMSGWLRSGEDAGFDVTSATISAESDTGDDGDRATELAPLSDSAAGPEATEAPADTVAPDTTAAAADATSSEESADLAADLSESDLPEALDDFRRRAETQQGTVPDRFDCEPPSGVTESPVAVEEVAVEGAPAWLAAFGDAAEITSVAAYRRADCDILSSDP